MIDNNMMQATPRTRHSDAKHDWSELCQQTSTSTSHWLLWIINQHFSLSKRATE